MTRRVLSGTAAARGSALGRARVRLPHALDVAEARIPAGEVDAELDRIGLAMRLRRAVPNDPTTHSPKTPEHSIGASNVPTS